MTPRCPRHDRRMVREDRVETLAYEWGREVYRPATLFACPERGCAETRVEGAR